jgi:hypothetical protein
MSVINPKTKLHLILFFCLVSIGMQAQITGDTRTVEPTKTETVEILMQTGKSSPVVFYPREERPYPSRKDLPDNPNALPNSAFPSTKGRLGSINAVAQTLGTSFKGVSGPSETGAYPPDNMGAVGPTQYIVAVNGRLRTFNKTTGIADGVLNLNHEVFFASVMTAGSYTSDPRIRFDRFSGKWIIIIIDVASTSNRLLIAVSNTSTITASTVWSFSYFIPQAGAFTDYPTLGVDVNALYIGTNMFSSSSGSFIGTNGYVINRAALVSGGAYSVTSFIGLVTGVGAAGVLTPQGVDNNDPNATEGYFIGVDNAVFSLLVMRKVLTPGGTPTLSGNININVPSTTYPSNVPNLGGATALDAIDDRLFAATIHNGHLWTAHHFRVNTSGISSNAAGYRNGVRWYDLNLSPSTPTVSQSGTIFDNTAAVGSAKWYFFPSVMVSGQGHAAFSMTTAGAAFRANAATTGRLATDPINTTQDITNTTNSTTAYNAPYERWGDYSFVSLDPEDNQTMWMVNQYCDGTNTYGCNVTKLIAPPPAAPTSCSPNTIASGLSSVSVTLTGTATAGSGFYDPGTNLPSPALAFKHIAAAIPGVVVNSITYTNPTTITLDLNTVGAVSGLKNITITNPDGQFLASVGGILTVTPSCTGPNYTFTGASGTPTDPTVAANWSSNCIPTFNNPANIITVNAGTIFNATSTQISGSIINNGTIKGSLNLLGPITNNGTVSPGN